MRKFRTFLFFLIIEILPSLVIGQELVSSQGEHYISSTGSLSWSLGEPVSETVSGTISMLNQGFHQDLEASSGFDLIDGSQPLALFPNPTSGILTAFSSSASSFDHLEIRDSRDRIVCEKFDLHFPASLDLSFLEPGTYFIVFISQTHQPLTVKVIKY